MGGTRKGLRRRLLVQATEVVLLGDPPAIGDEVQVRVWATIISRTEAADGSVKVAARATAAELVVEG